MFKKTYESVMASFTKVVDDLKDVAETRTKTMDKIEDEIKDGYLALVDLTGYRK